MASKKRGGQGSEPPKSRVTSTFLGDPPGFEPLDEVAERSGARMTPTADAPMKVQERGLTTSEAVSLLPQPLGEDDRLKFALTVLKGIGLLTIVMVAAHLFRPTDGFLELVKTVFPPLVTLILGFYFGKKG